MNRLRLATLWLGGCSGCHMSFLDLDEWLIELAERVDVVYSPLADVKEYPEGVDLALIEGAIANEEHLHIVKWLRPRTKTVVSFGDCALTGNVTALRNPLGDPQAILRQVYAPAGGPIPSEEGIVPVLLPQVRPVHAVIPVEIYLPGCPPPATRIRAVLQALLNGESPQLVGREMLKFG